MASVEIQGLDERRRALEHILSTDPDMRKRLQGCIRTILREVRNSLAKDASSGLQMKSDPRHAYKAVRSAVYRRILGGQVNILQKRRAGSPTGYEPPRTDRTGKRGGNRMLRSERTRQMMGYEGADRGFILRFLNQGTADRVTTSFTDRMGNRNNLRHGNVSIRSTHATGANRGAISARNWFGGASQRVLEKTAAQFDELIDRVIKNEFK